MESIFSSVTGSIAFIILLLFFHASSTFTCAAAPVHSLDPNGNITIKWDLLQWTPDGYIAVVTMYNYQKYRSIQAPGWTLGWTWSGKELIWSMMGAQTTEQGDCSRFKGNIPHSCKNNPTVVDLLPGTPFNQQVPNCCKGGVLSPWGQNPATAVSSFQVSVGAAGTTNRTVRLPRNFTLKAPGRPGYTCGPARIVRPTRFITPDKRRITQALMTWNLTCTYSPFLAKTPSCCVSLSSFRSKSIVNCPTCACGCKNSRERAGTRTCVNSSTPHSPSVVSPGKSDNYTPLVQCTSHMCPIRVHWQVKPDYKEYWRVEVTIINFNYRMNYSQWSLVVQHPNFDNLTEIFSYNHKLLAPHNGQNDSLLWRVKFDNDSLSRAVPLGSTELELLFRKDKTPFRSQKGWAFPRRIYFNGDNCVMPPSEAYT